MELFHAITMLLLGLVLIVAGANYLTDGAEAIAIRLGVSKLVIGLTVVAFGSSAPDFFVCLISALQGKSTLATGDVVGSNIFDLLLAAGIVAMIRPFSFTEDMKSELPMLALSGFALFVCADDRLLDCGAIDIISRTDGLLLLCFFIISMVITLRMARQKQPLEAIAERNLVRSRHTRQPSASAHLMPEWLSWLCVIGGLAALIIGGNWIVDSASVIARKAGMSEAMVGLTIVAFGNASPDLATSVIAAIKKQPDIAIGNIVGACIFNVFFIIGVCACCTPISSHQLSVTDYSVLLGAGILLWIFSRLGKGICTRLEGLIMVILYLAYWAYLIICGLK